VLERTSGFFRSWVKEAQDRVAGQSGGMVDSRPDQRHAADRIAAEKDPLACLLSWKLADDERYRMYVGMNQCGWVRTEPRRNLLILGPPRSDKTAGVLVPLILTAPGPVVSTSTKTDVLTATGIGRARMGRVWHYSPDGGATPPGATPLRWSPITASAQWDIALSTADAMVRVVNMREMQDGAYWASTSTSVLAPVLHAAALGGESMRWVMRMIAAVDGSGTAEVESILERGGAQRALDTFRSVTGMASERTRSSVLSAAATTLDVYRLSGALATTEHPNFDPDCFVAGEPDVHNPARWEAAHVSMFHMGIERNDHQLPVGRYDTLYITASSENQGLVAPLVVALLSQIRSAAYRRNAQDELEGVFDRMPVTLALDELYGMAPLPDLPSMLSDCASQGVLVAACLQDLAQAKERWDAAAEGFLTVFGNLFVLRGLRNPETLQALSSLAGKCWVQVEGVTRDYHVTRGRDWSSSQGYSVSSTPQQIDVLQPSQISQGHPADPRLALFFTREGFQWIHGTPFFSSAPWPQALVGSIRRFGSMPEHPAHLLPLPHLDRDRDGRYLVALGGPQLAQDFHDLSNESRAVGEQLRARRAALRAHPLLQGAVDVDEDFPLRSTAIASHLLLAEPAADASQELFGELGARPGTIEDEWELGSIVATPSWIVDVGHLKALVFFDDRLVQIEREDHARWHHLTTLLGGEPGAVASVVCTGFEAELQIAMHVLAALATRFGGVTSGFDGAALTWSAASATTNATQPQEQGELP
jgi:type IV secretory pathway TraG/TraD family ATPase VirD4